MLGLYVESKERVAQKKFSHSYPAPSTISFQPACLGRGSRAGSRWEGGGREGGLGRKFPPPAGNSARGHIRCCCAAKLPATPWIGWAHGVLCQATLGPLSLYASWWVPTLRPYLQPGNWGKKTHFPLLPLAFWAGGRQVGDGQESPGGTTRYPGDRGVVLSEAY